MKSSRGFTLVELMIYAGLTAMVVGLFGAILVTILRVQGEQSSSSQVSSELSFIMTTIKRHIHEAVSIDTFVPNQLTINKNSSVIILTFDPDTHALIISDTSIPSIEQINSGRINIDSATFDRLQDADNPASLAIRVSITASANTTDPGRQTSRTLQATASPFLQSQ